MTVKALISLYYGVMTASSYGYWRSRRIESNIKAKTSTKKKSSQQLDDGTASGDHPPTVEDHYRSIYFQTLDVVINCIESRFDQLRYGSYSRLESLLLKAASKKNFTEDLNFVCDLYKDDLECNSLKYKWNHLQLIQKKQLLL